MIANQMYGFVAQLAMPNARYVSMPAADGSVSTYLLDVTDDAFALSSPPKATPSPGKRLGDRRGMRRDQYRGRTTADQRRFFYSSAISAVS
ncbi:MAG: hypothetical protein ACRDPK_11420 [Carbonactinosporaceae bacterium]